MITFPVLLTSGDTAFDTLTRQMAHLRFSVTFSPFAAEARKLVSETVSFSLIESRQVHGTCTDFYI